MIFVSRRVIELRILDVDADWYTWLSCNLWRLRLIYIYNISHFILSIGFVYGQFDHSAYDFISWLSFYSCECSYVVDKTSTLLWMFMVYIFHLNHSVLVLWYYFMIISCISLICDYLLVNEGFKPKNYKNNSHFLLVVLRLY